MYLQDLIGEKDELLLAAMQHPTLKPKRNPTIELALKSVSNEVQSRVMKTMQDKMQPVLQEILDHYELENGEYKELVEANSAAYELADYGSGIDDKVENAVAAYTVWLSADWLGRMTIDTRLWEENAPAKLALSLGKEVYKQLSFDKTPAQTLASAGITKDEVEMYLMQHLANPQENNKVTSQHTITSVASLIRNHVGDGFDTIQVFDDIQQIMDNDDEVLTGGAAERLGLDASAIDAISVAAMDMDDPAQEILELVMSAEGGAPDLSAPETPATRPTEVAPGESLNPRILELLKGSGAQDAAMAEAVGVSRSTYINWSKGKTPFKPDGDQYGILRAECVKRANNMLEALSLLDNTAKQEVA